MEVRRTKPPQPISLINYRKYSDPLEEAEIFRIRSFRGHPPSQEMTVVAVDHSAGKFSGDQLKSNTILKLVSKFRARRYVSFPQIQARSKSQLYPVCTNIETTPDDPNSTDLRCYRELYKLNSTERERSIHKRRGEWVRGEMLGEGGFGKVYMAMFPEPTASYFKDFPEIAAVKSTALASSMELVHEKNVYCRLRDCPSILKYLGHDITESKEDKSLLMNVFLEYAAGGTLMDLLNESGWTGLLEPQVKRYTRSMLKGIEQIHREGFIHCDLRLENVLLVEDGDGGYVAKVADLGLARRDGEEGICGTVLYWAPEMVRHNIQGKPSDVWAVGCLVLAILTGELPWRLDLTEEEHIEFIRTESPTLPCGIFSDAAESFLYQCFRDNPDKRPSAATLLSHPFLCQLDDAYDDKKPTAPY